MCADWNMQSVQLSLTGEREGVEKEKGKNIPMKQLEIYVNIIQM